MMVSIIKIVLFTKPTAEHQYLLRSSCHPLHTKRPFPFSLALRIRTICSSNETYNIGILTQATHPHVSLLLSDTTQPLARYHPYFTSTFTSSIFHKHIYIIYISQAHLHSLILPTLCVTFLRTNKPRGGYSLMRG